MVARVLHVVESLKQEAGSVAISLPGLFDALGGCDIESASVALDRAAGFSLREWPHGLKHVADSKAVARLVERADIVHLHGWGHHLARTMARAAIKKAKPYIISPHGSLCVGIHNQKRWRDRLRDLLVDNRLIRKASGVTALNEAEEYELQTARIHPNIVRLPYGIDMDSYVASPSSQRHSRQRPPQGAAATVVEEAATVEEASTSNGRYLLILAPIHPVEGFVPFLKALSELGPEFDGWKVVLAGPETGDWRKMLEAAVRRKGGDGRVVFAPASDPAAQRAWLSRASILATPSLHIRCPVSIMQALAAGVPVLATSLVTPAGLEDVIRVCAPTRGDLKMGLRSLLGLSDEDRAALAQRARKVGRELFDWSVLVDQYVRLYRSLI